MGYHGDRLVCDGEQECQAPVTYIDDKGYTYCTAHGVMRRVYRRCRKLTRAELVRLQAGAALERF